MFAPALVAVFSLSWAYVTATPMDLLAIRAGQNLIAALSAALIPVNYLNFS